MNFSPMSLAVFVLSAVLLWLGISGHIQPTLDAIQGKYVKPKKAK